MVRRYCLFGLLILALFAGYIGNISGNQETSDPKAAITKFLAPSDSTPVSESATAPSDAPVNATLLSEEEGVQAGRPFWIAVRLNIEDKWHTYWKNPGDAGFPPSIEWNLPSGFKASEIEWPSPTRFTVGSSVGYGYEKEVLFLVRITPPKDLPKDPIELSAEIRWLACSDSNCLPGDFQAKITLPVVAQEPKQDSKAQNDFARARKALPNKEWGIEASNKDGKVQLSLKHPEDGHKRNLTDAYFCAEERELIDLNQACLLTSMTGTHDQYSLTLPIKNVASASKVLKGVLIVFDKSDPEKTREAISVNLYIPKQPGEVFLSTDPIADADRLEGVLTPSNPAYQELMPDANYQGDWQGGMWMAVFFAFIGGIILNLMPCVLPVVSLKVLGFVSMAQQSRSLTMKHGLAFFIGVLASFWALAGTLLLLQAYGSMIGWGFQLQEPLFVAGLASILLIFGLSLFGVFEIGLSVSSWAGQAASDAQKSNTKLFGSFLSGILATAVATPCTGPFLGSAIGYAVTLSPMASLLIFTSLGVGMALPYLVFAMFPALLRFLPKPGHWMITFKEVMGFLMLATVTWLVWVFAAQTDETAVFLLLMGFIGIAIATWIHGKWGNPLKSKTKRRLSTILSCLFLALGGFTIYAASTKPVSDGQLLKPRKGWERFSSQKVAELHKKGTPVLIDFTAKWCLICQTNHLVFLLPDVNKKLEELGVVKMEADWTRRDPEITEALKEFGRNGVPLYVLYGKDPDAPPVILPQVLTTETVLENLNKI